MWWQWYEYLCAEISIADCIVCMVQLYAVVAKLGEVCFKWFVLLWSASTELAKDVLSSDIRSGGVQTSFECVPLLVMICLLLTIRRTAGEPDSLIIDAASASLAF